MCLESVQHYGRALLQRVHQQAVTVSYLRNMTKRNIISEINKEPVTGGMLLGESRVDIANGRNSSNVPNPSGYRKQITN